MSETSKSTSWSQWTEVPSGGVMTPTVSEEGTELYASGSHVSESYASESHVSETYAFESMGSSVASSTMTQRAGLRGVARISIIYKFATFPPTRAVDSMSMDQPPNGWHKVMNFVSGPEEATAKIEASIKAIACSENAASKLNLVIIFAHAYAANHPTFWKLVKGIAAKELFSFVAAPDRYYCTITGLDKCKSAIKDSELSYGKDSYVVKRNGAVLDMRIDMFRVRETPNHTTDIWLANLPELIVHVL